MKKDNKNTKINSPWIMMALVLVVALVFAAIYRFYWGLGAATNLSDDIPWGLWIGVDVLAGVALAAGGFAIAGAVYIFNLPKYKPIARAAVLTAFAGYVVVSISLFFDIGKPLSLWHPLIMWQPHSIMFEVTWCVVLYTIVLALEFAGPYLESIGAKKTATIMTGRPVLVPLAIAAVTLSFLHQSSLGALFLLIPSKLHHLWWTTMLPYNFFISAIAAGLAMVSFESIIAAKVFHHRLDPEILQGLAKGTAITLLVYFILRMGDILVKGNISLMFDGGAGTLFLFEMIFFVLIPMLMLFKNTRSTNGMGVMMPQVLVLLGVVFNRLNILFLIQYKQGVSYYPSIVEMAITLGLIASIIVVYKIAIIKLPITTLWKTYTSPDN